MEQPFVFVHITDIHLQRRSAESSYDYFRHFVKDILPVIQPSLVVNTGDITQSQQLNLKGNCLLPIFDVQKTWSTMNGFCGLDIG